MKPIYQLSATVIAEKIRKKEISVTEVATSFLERILTVNPVINALQQFDAERILNAAKYADKSIKKKTSLGKKLYGIPMTLKDAFHIKGFKCSKGCPGLLKDLSHEDATVVKRLKDEGAIVLGITNVPELLLSYETDNSIYGATNNPYDIARTSGGSSGGEAAIIATGGSPMGIGTDAGGSVRQPAHYCGICAHKPTQGLVPLTGNFPQHGAGIATQVVSFGPMARYVEDLIVLMGIISGYDELDPHSVVTTFKNPMHVDISQLRIAYFYHIGQVEGSKDTIATIDKVVKYLRVGARFIEQVYPKVLDDVFKLHMETFMFGGDGGESLIQLFKTFGGQKPSYLMQQYLKKSAKCHLSVFELRQRFVSIEQFRYSMMDFMQNYDIIISPVAATPARCHQETPNHLEEFSYAMAHNLTGWPASVVPIAKTASGLPIAVQIAAKPWCDHLTLALAYELQQHFGVLPIVEM